MHSVKNIPDLLSMTERVDFRGWAAWDILVVRPGDLQQVQELLAFSVLFWPLDVEGCGGKGL